MDTDAQNARTKAVPQLPLNTPVPKAALVAAVSISTSLLLYAAMEGGAGRLAQLLAGSWVSVVVVAATLTAVGLTVFRLARVATQDRWTRWLRTEVLPSAMGKELPPGAACHAINRIEMSVLGLPSALSANNLLLWRTRSLLEILDRGGHPAGAGAAARELAELDRERLSSSFDLVGLLVWAIPILGFIGTVLGISISVGSFSGLLTSLQGAGAINDQMQPALAGVTSGLAVAFDTTLLALLLSIPLLFANSMVRARAARHLDLVDESVLSVVLPALARAMEGKLGTDAASEGKLLADQLRALQAVARDMSEAMVATYTAAAADGKGNGSGIHPVSSAGSREGGR